MEQMTAAKATRQRASDMAFCADDSNLMFTRHNVPKATKLNWITGRDLWIAEVSGRERVFTPVVIRSPSIKTELDKKAGRNDRNVKSKYNGKERPLQLLWMDCITGSVFDNSGRCQTSDTLCMDLDTIHKHDEKAKEILLNAKCVDTERISDQ